MNPTPPILATRLLPRASAHEDTGTPRALRRRDLTLGATWAVPSVTLSAFSPAYAASTDPAVLTSQLWFSGQASTTSTADTCSVPDFDSATAACPTNSYYPWSTRFQFYGTNNQIYSNSTGQYCVRDSWISISNISLAEITGGITLKFWRPEIPSNYSTASDIRTWYRGTNDSGKWTIPARTVTPAQYPFSGTFANVAMYEYQTTLSLAYLTQFMVDDGQGGVTLNMTKATAALSFYTDCMPFYYTMSQDYRTAYSRLGRYVISIPNARDGLLVKDTGFYTA